MMTHVLDSYQIVRQRKITETVQRNNHATATNTTLPSTLEEGLATNNGDVPPPSKPPAAPTTRKNTRTIVSSWFHQLQQNGGDFQRRAPEALRLAMGSFGYFSMLVFGTNPQHISAIWIGNIFLHLAVQANWGASLQAAWGLAMSIMWVTMGSWPIAYGLALLTEGTLQILLPPLVFALSFIVMSCPWLVSPNLMILVMYVNVATPLRFETTGWEPLTNMASYWIGLAVAIAMNLLPPWRPNTATQQAHAQIHQMGQDLEALWNLKQQYTFNTGRSSKHARVAGAEIQVLVQRIDQGVKALRGLVPAVSVELWWTSRYARAKRLEDWVKVMEASMKDFVMLQSALNSRFLGETSGNSTISTRYVRRLIADELGVDYLNFVQDLIDCTLQCNRIADPFWIRPPNGVPMIPESYSNEKLVAGIEKARIAFGRVFEKLLEEVQVAKSMEECGTPTPIFAHLARRSTALYAVLSIAETLGKHLDSIRQLPTVPKTTHRGQTLFMLQSMGIMNWRARWLWNDAVHRRLGLKTAIGMLLASLWMAVPGLWKISEPFGFWPGLTVASVNLAATGSSFRKAIDRLVGTLFAAAYALLVADFFPGNYDAVKVPAIAVFTAFVIYMKSDEHAYQYSYAATSIGSILYGSVKNNYNVEGYIPLRIQLIFIGVITFAMVELFLFPKSSRHVVENSVLEFLSTVQELLHKAGEYAVFIQNPNNDRVPMNDEQGNASAATLSKSHLQGLTDLGRKLTEINSTLKKELKFALLEPYFGFAHKLHSQSMNTIVAETGNVEMKALLLINALSLVERIHAGPDITFAHEPNWHRSFADFLERAGLKMDASCRDLQEAFPDGRFHPQNGNTVRAIAAAASFREFRDVRFSIVSSWSHTIQQGAESSSMPDVNFLIFAGITTAFILELCRHLQLVGKGMERATGEFPPFY